MKIYLAGKIRANCWRHTIVDGLRYVFHDAEIEKVAGGFPVLKRAIFDTHDYVGPFFMSCDHGCYHKDSGHGIGAWDSESGGHGTPYGCSPHDDELPRRSRVVQMCLDAIDRADLVFAWIDDPTCYGTLAELGYAIGKGKRVWVVFDEAEDDGVPYRLGGDGDEALSLSANLWFVEYAAERVVRHYVKREPADVLREMLKVTPQELRTMPYQDYLQTDHWKQTRAVALDAAGRRCQLCNSPERLQVHHRTYERRGEELPSDLIVLCNSCHSTFHANGKVHR